MGRWNLRTFKSNSWNIKNGYMFLVVLIQLKNQSLLHRNSRKYKVQHVRNFACYIKRYYPYIQAKTVFHLCLLSKLVISFPFQRLVRKVCIFQSRVAEWMQNHLSSIALFKHLSLPRWNFNFGVQILWTVSTSWYWNDCTVCFFSFITSYHGENVSNCSSHLSILALFKH